MIPTSKRGVWWRQSIGMQKNSLSPVRTWLVIALENSLGHSDVSYFYTHSSELKRRPCYVECMCGNVCLCVCMCIALVPGAHRLQKRESNLDWSYRQLWAEGGQSELNSGSLQDPGAISTACPCFKNKYIFLVSKPSHLKKKVFLFVFFL